MTDRSIARATGMFGLACVVLSWAQFPLWVIGGVPPFDDGWLGMLTFVSAAVTGLFMAAAGWATFESGVLPRWTAWIACISAAFCVLSMPAMFAGPVDASGFYNAGGWGPAVIANFPPLIWFLVVGIVLIRKGGSATGFDLRSR